MTAYLVELYISRSGGDGVERRFQRARRAADELTRTGLPVHCQRSIFVPDEETWFLLYEADSGDLVREAVLRAGLVPDRISEAIADSNGSAGLPPLDSPATLTRCDGYGRPRRSRRGAGGGRGVPGRD